jgi:AhpD family alkylhydroperoxidase
MQPASLLARSGLSKDVRILIGAATTTWHADWPGLSAWVTAGQQQQLIRTALEETMLQCVLFCGFPRVITAFEQLNNAWPTDTAPSGGGLPEAEQMTAGSELFGAIYGKNDATVRSMLKGCHQELHDFVLEAAYGRILTRPNLSGKTRELIAVALLAAQGQKRQFAGHARGAMHLGATRKELQEALVTAFPATPEAVDSWLTLVRQSV